MPWVMLAMVGNWCALCHMVEKCHYVVFLPWEAGNISVSMWQSLWAGAVQNHFWPQLCCPNSLFSNTLFCFQYLKSWSVCVCVSVCIHNKPRYMKKYMLWSLENQLISWKTMKNQMPLSALWTSDFCPNFHHRIYLEPSEDAA